MLKAHFEMFKMFHPRNENSSPGTGSLRKQGMTQRLKQITRYKKDAATGLGRGDTVGERWEEQEGPLGRIR